MAKYLILETVRGAPEAWIGEITNAVMDDVACGVALAFRITDDGGIMQLKQDGNSNGFDWVAVKVG